MATSAAPAPELGTGQDQGLNEQPPVAVDSSGDVWVGDLERLEEFNEKGEYVTEVQLPGAGVVESLAVDASGDFYLKSWVSRVSASSNPTSDPAALYPVLDEAGRPNAVALDPATGDLLHQRPGRTTPAPRYGDAAGV